MMYTISSSVILLLMDVTSVASLWIPEALGRAWRGQSHAQAFVSSDHYQQQRQNKYSPSLGRRQTTGLFATIYYPDGRQEEDEDEYSSSSSYLMSLDGAASFQSNYYDFAMIELLKKDHMDSLARLAVAFSRPEHGFTLGDIETIHILDIDLERISLSVAVGTGRDALVTVAVDVPFPNSCRLKSSSSETSPEVDANMAMASCMLDNILELDEKAKEIIDRMGLKSKEEVEREQQIKAELCNANLISQLPFWWVRPGFWFEEECHSMKGLLNNKEYQPELKALATIRIVETVQAIQLDDPRGLRLEVTYAYVASVGPAGLLIRAQVKHMTSTDKKETMIVYDVPIRFDNTAKRSGELKKIVLEFIDSISKMEGKITINTTKAENIFEVSAESEEKLPAMELQPSKKISDYPDWWVFPGLPYAYDCSLIKDMMNIMAGQPDLLKLASYHVLRQMKKQQHQSSAKEQMDIVATLGNRLEVQQAGVVSVGPAGLILRAHVKTMTSDGTDGDVITCDCPIQFPTESSNVDDLRTKVIELVESTTVELEAAGATAKPLEQSQNDSAPIALVANQSLSAASEAESDNAGGKIDIAAPMRTGEDLTDASLVTNVQSVVDPPSGTFLTNAKSNSEDSSNAKVAMVAEQQNPPTNVSIGPLGQADLSKPPSVPVENLKDTSTNTTMKEIIQEGVSIDESSTNNNTDAHVASNITMGKDSTVSNAKKTNVSPSPISKVQDLSAEQNPNQEIETKKETDSEIEAKAEPDQVQSIDSRTKLELGNATESTAKQELVRSDSIEGHPTNVSRAEDVENESKADAKDGPTAGMFDANNTIINSTTILEDDVRSVSHEIRDDPTDVTTTARNTTSVSKVDRVHVSADSATTENQQNDPRSGGEPFNTNVTRFKDKSTNPKSPVKSNSNVKESNTTSRAVEHDLLVGAKAKDDAPLNAAFDYGHAQKSSHAKRVKNGPIGPIDALIISKVLSDVQAQGPASKEKAVKEPSIDSDGKKMNVSAAMNATAKVEPVQSKFQRKQITEPTKSETEVNSSPEDSKGKRSGNKTSAAQHDLKATSQAHVGASSSKNRIENAPANSVPGSKSKSDYRPQATARYVNIEEKPGENEEKEVSSIGNATGVIGALNATEKVESVQTSKHEELIKLTEEEAKIDGSSDNMTDMFKSKDNDFKWGAGAEPNNSTSASQSHKGGKTPRNGNQKVTNASESASKSKSDSLLNSQSRAKDVRDETDMKHIVTDLNETARKILTPLNASRKAKPMSITNQENTKQAEARANTDDSSNQSGRNKNRRSNRSISASSNDSSKADDVAKKSTTRMQNVLTNVQTGTKLKSTSGLDSQSTSKDVQIEAQNDEKEVKDLLDGKEEAPTLINITAKVEPTTSHKAEETGKITQSKAIGENSPRKSKHKNKNTNNGSKSSVEAVPRDSKETAQSSGAKAKEIEDLSFVSKQKVNAEIAVNLDEFDKFQSELCSESNISEFPDWWVAPSLSFQENCDTLKTLLNHREFQSDLKAVVGSILADKDRVQTAAEDSKDDRNHVVVVPENVDSDKLDLKTNIGVQVRNTGVASVGPAGVLIRARVMSSTDNEITVYDVPVPFSKETSSMEGLLANIAAMVDSTKQESQSKVTP